MGKETNNIYEVYSVYQVDLTLLEKFVFALVVIKEVISVIS